MSVLAIYRAIESPIMIPMLTPILEIGCDTMCCTDSGAFISVLGAKNFYSDIQWLLYFDFFIAKIVQEHLSDHSFYYN